MVKVVRVIPCLLNVILIVLTLVIQIQGSPSVVIKVGNGLERIVVSIDETLTLPSSIPHHYNNGEFRSGSKGVTLQDCQTILEQLKVRCSASIDSFCPSIV